MPETIPISTHYEKNWDPSSIILFHYIA